MNEKTDLCGGFCFLNVLMYFYFFVLMWVEEVRPLPVPTHTPSCHAQSAAQHYGRKASAYVWLTSCIIYVC